MKFTFSFLKILLQIVRVLQKFVILWEYIYFQIKERKLCKNNKLRFYDMKPSAYKLSSTGK